jgi:hypothetical protein
LLKVQQGLHLVSYFSDIIWGALLRWRTLVEEESDALKTPQIDGLGITPR